MSRKSKARARMREMRPYPEETLHDFAREVAREARKERERKRNEPKPIKPLTEQGKEMAEIVENIALESENCGYNPKRDANWDILPMEMRAECIKRMDFITRIQLRATSEIEESLVDARKSYYDKLLIQTKGHYDEDYRTTLCSFSMELVKPDQFSRGGMERSDLDGVHLNKHAIRLLKNCEFGEIQCFAFGAFRSGHTSALEKCAPFRFESLKSKGGNFYMAEFFLLHSAQDVENVELNVKFQKDFSIEEFTRFPSFTRAKRVIIEYMPFEDLLEEAKWLAKEWSELDVEIGTKCHFNTGSTKDLITGGIREKFTIEMKNETKIVLIIVNSNPDIRQKDVEAYVVPKPKDLE